MSKNNKTDLPGADLLFGSHGKSSGQAPAIARKEEGILKGSEYKIAKVEETEPVKFTFYFEPQVLDDLEVAKFRLKMEKRLKVSKSDIVNASVKHCMKDLIFLQRLVSGELE